MISDQFALEIKNLSKTYKSGTKALNNINLTINQGDFFGLLGANGAGKTTIIGIITGLINKSEGEVKVYGKNADQEVNEVKSLIGVVPQEFNFSIFEKVEDIIRQQAGYFGIPSKEAKLRTDELLETLELKNKHNLPARTLSGGMKRRLMIARALVHEPKLLILDEPTAGVDVELRHGMWEYLKKLNNTGTTILLTTHYLEEAEELCKNIAIIKNGQIQKSDSTKTLLSGITEETYIVTTDKIPNRKDLNYKLTEDKDLEILINQELTLNTLVTHLSKLGIKILNIRPKGNRLEQLFLNSLKNDN